MDNSPSNDVPPGYKRTEVGVIPEDWNLRPLVSLVDPQRGIRYGIVQPGREDLNGRFMIRGQDYADGWADSSTIFRVSSQVEQAYKNARVQTGDLLITIVGASTGGVAVVPEWLDRANLTQTTARIAIDPYQADSRFCMCMLQSHIGAGQTANYIKGGAQPGLNCGDVEKFLIPLPPTFPEQRAIAEALSDMDGLIAALDKLITKKRAIKQATMQQLLTGKRRLPGFEKTPGRKLTEVGEIPDDWGVRSLGDLASAITKGESIQWQGSDYVEIGIPFLRTEDVSADGTINLSNCKLITPQTHERMKRSQFQAGDIVISIASTLGRCGLITEHVVPANTNQDLALVRLNDSAASCEFILRYLLGQAVQKQIAIVAQGATRLNLNLKQVSELKVTLPSLAEQRAIATVLADIEAEIAALERRRDKTKQIKQGMMQQLLTGRVRLVKSEATR